MIWLWLIISSLVGLRKLTPILRISVPLIKKSVNQKCFFLLLIFNYLFKSGMKSVSRENIEYDWAQFLLTGNSFVCEFHKAKFNHSPLIPPLSQPAEREKEREGKPKFRIRLEIDRIWLLNLQEESGSVNDPRTFFFLYKYLIIKNDFNEQIWIIQISLFLLETDGTKLLKKNLSG